MKKIAITATALLLSAGTALAADNNLSPTTNPSSSGRPSAILSANECQNVWNQALNQSESGMPSMSSNSTSGSSNPGSSASGGGAASNAGAPSASGTASGSLGSSTGSNVPSSDLSSSSAASDGSQSGGISKEQAIPFVANFAMVDKNNDGQISQAEFQDGCKNGWVQTASGNGTGKSSSGSTGSSNPSKSY